MFRHESGQSVLHDLGTRCRAAACHVDVQGELLRGCGEVARAGVVHRLEEMQALAVPFEQLERDADRVACSNSCR